jgi:hypothetical protein
VARSPVVIPPLACFAIVLIPIYAAFVSTPVDSSFRRFADRGGRQRIRCRELHTGGDGENRRAGVRSAWRSQLAATLLRLLWLACRPIIGTHVVLRTPQLRRHGLRIAPTRDPRDVARGVIMPNSSSQFEAPAPHRADRSRTSLELPTSTATAPTAAALLRYWAELANRSLATTTMTIVRSGTRRRNP